MEQNSSNLENLINISANLEIDLTTFIISLFLSALSAYLVAYI